MHDEEPVVEANVPEEQSVQLAAPAFEKVPVGQTVGLMEERGQKEPAGQRTGAPEGQ